VQFYDLFSGHAEIYAASRPNYPPELFRFLASVCSMHQAALDCATGSGQAARELVNYFDKVYACDASQKQLDQAVPHERIQYHCVAAETDFLLPGSVDLVVIAQALHWMDLDRFYAAMRKVGSQHAVIAAWCYGLHRISPEVDAVIDYLYGSLLGSYWPVQRVHIESGYQNLSFPFAAIPAPEFRMSHQWSMQQLMAYLESWSAVQKFRASRKTDPVAELYDRLHAAWGNRESRTVTWPLTIKVGRLH
jgi:hypothetical protein